MMAKVSYPSFTGLQESILASTGTILIMPNLD